MSTGNQDIPKKQVGQYYLMEKIAQGGMAEIFKGLSYDVSGIKKTVCIKKILPHIAASQEFIDSLIQEAKIAVNLVHGNIAQTYDLGKVGEDYFMVMEYVDGKTLSQINKRCQTSGKTMPVQFAVYFVAEALSGLDYIHRRTDDDGRPLHIVHRDMSPQNIMVSYSGTVKIIDFGIAKTGLAIGATDAGILKGKFAYMSPEQAYGDTIDNRSDIFSVGVILYESLAGKRLFKGQDSRETIRNVRQTKVEPPSLLRPDVPDELDRIVLKSLAKDKKRRYAKASDMNGDLVKFLHQNFPDFRPADAAEFVQELFKDELEGPKKEEADSKTPYLIIDRTNSALADESQFEVTGRAKVPANFSEYMIEEKSEAKAAPPEEEPKAEDAGSSLVSIDDEFLELMMARRERVKKRSKMIRTAMIISMASVLVVGGYLFNRFALKKDQAAPPAAGTADIMVVADPADSEVVLDGKPAGRGSPVTIKGVASKEEHTLLVRRDGFLDHERKLEPAPGEFMNVSVKLSRKELSKASVELRTSPPGATVFVDDKETLHRTPATIERMEPGIPHKIGLYLQGYKFWTRDVMSKSGETRSFDIQLEKDFATLKIESDPPDALVMIDGTPVGQTPLAKDNLEPDREMKVEVWKDGFDSESREVKAVAGRSETLRFVLKKAKDDKGSKEEKATDAGQE